MVGVTMIVIAMILTSIDSFLGSSSSPLPWKNCVHEHPHLSIITSLHHDNLVEDVINYLLMVTLQGIEI